MSYLAITLPLIVTTLAFVLFPIRLYRYVTKDDAEDLIAEKKPLTSADIFAVQVPMLAIFLALGVLLGWAQHDLAQVGKEETDALFVFRMFDRFSTHLLPELFVGLAVGALFSFHLTTLRDREFVLRALGRKEFGVSGYRQMRLLGPIAFTFAILAVTWNFFAAQSFIEVARSEVRYHAFLSGSTEVLPVSELRRVSLYEKRKMPLGNVIESSYVELEFASGQVVDTFDIIDEDGLPAMIKALRKVAPEDTVFRELPQKQE